MISTHVIKRLICTHNIIKSNGKDVLNDLEKLIKVTPRKITIWPSGRVEPLKKQVGIFIHEPSQRIKPIGIQKDI
jgi:hypothetical protein